LDVAIVGGLGALLLGASGALAAEWAPARWAGEDTVEIGTTEPGGDLHWFPVWLVVIDDELYVRLGGQASERFEENVSRPYVGVRIAGHVFPKVQGIPAPEKASAVDAKMEDKYWSDVFVRWMDHPLTLRLESVQ
jgi:hypothetical protein